MMAGTLPQPLVLVLLAARCVLWLVAYRHGIEFDTFRAIKPGMTAREAEAVLGPPGDHTVGRVRIGFENYGDGQGIRDTVTEFAVGLRARRPFRPERWWYTNRGSVRVVWDDCGRVLDAAYFGSFPDARHPPTRWLFLLGLGDGKPFGLDR